MVAAWSAPNAAYMMKWSTPSASYRLSFSTHGVGRARHEIGEELLGRELVADRLGGWRSRP